MANIEVYDTHSCAISEIHNLKFFQNKPREAMQGFCKLSLGKPVAWKIVDPSGNDKGRDGALFSFYFFSSPLYRGKASYGEQFAKFIEDERLGSIVTTPGLINHAYHPDHANQIWIWMPNVKALESWWKVNKPAPKKGL